MLKNAFTFLMLMLLSLTSSAQFNRTHLAIDLDTKDRTPRVQRGVGYTATVNLSNKFIPVGDLTVPPSKEAATPYERFWFSAEDTSDANMYVTGVAETDLAGNMTILGIWDSPDYDPTSPTLYTLPSHFDEDRTINIWSSSPKLLFNDPLRYSFYRKRDWVPTFDVNGIADLYQGCVAIFGMDQSNGTGWNQMTPEEKADFRFDPVNDPFILIMNRQDHDAGADTTRDYDGTGIEFIQASVGNGSGFTDSPDDSIARQFVNHSGLWNAAWPSAVAPAQIQAGRRYLNTFGHERPICILPTADPGTRFFNTGEYWRADRDGNDPGDSGTLLDGGVLYEDMVEIVNDYNQLGPRFDIWFMHYGVGWSDLESTTTVAALKKEILFTINELKTVDLVPHDDNPRSMESIPIVAHYATQRYLDNHDTNVAKHTEFRDWLAAGMPDPDGKPLKHYAYASPDADSNYGYAEYPQSILGANNVHFLAEGYWMMGNRWFDMSLEAIGNNGGVLPDSPNGTVISIAAFDDSALGDGTIGMTWGEPDVIGKPTPINYNDGMGVYTAQISSDGITWNGSVAADQLIDADVSGTQSVQWSGLTNGTLYYMRVTYDNGQAVPASTANIVDRPEFKPEAFTITAARSTTNPDFGIEIDIPGGKPDSFDALAPDTDRISFTIQWVHEDGSIDWGNPDGESAAIVDDAADGADVLFHTDGNLASLKACVDHGGCSFRLKATNTPGTTYSDVIPNVVTEADLYSFTHSSDVNSGAAFQIETTINHADGTEPVQYDVYWSTQPTSGSPPTGSWVTHASAQVTGVTGDIGDPVTIDNINTGFASNTTVEVQILATNALGTRLSSDIDIVNLVDSGALPYKPVPVDVTAVDPVGGSSYWGVTVDFLVPDADPQTITNYDVIVYDNDDPGTTSTYALTGFVGNEIQGAPLTLTSPDNMNYMTSCPCTFAVTATNSAGTSTNTGAAISTTSTAPPPAVAIPLDDHGTVANEAWQYSLTALDVIGSDPMYFDVFVGDPSSDLPFGTADPVGDGWFLVEARLVDEVSETVVYTGSAFLPTVDMQARYRNTHGVMWVTDDLENTVLINDVASEWDTPLIDAMPNLVFHGQNNLADMKCVGDAGFGLCDDGDEVERWRSKQTGCSGNCPLYTDSGYATEGAEFVKWIDELNAIPILQWADKSQTAPLYDDSDANYKGLLFESAGGGVLADDAKSMTFSDGTVGELDRCMLGANGYCSNEVFAGGITSYITFRTHDTVNAGHMILGRTLETEATTAAITEGYLWISTGAVNASPLEFTGVIDGDIDNALSNIFATTNTLYGIYQTASGGSSPDGSIIEVWNISVDPPVRLARNVSTVNATNMLTGERNLTLGSIRSNWGNYYQQRYGFDGNVMSIVLQDADERNDADDEAGRAAIFDEMYKHSSE